MVSSVFACSLISSLSSFTFGMSLTSIGLVIGTINKNYVELGFTYEYNHYITLFSTIVFLGAFFSSYFNYFFDRFSKKNLLIFNNLFYFTGFFILWKFPRVYLGILARFIIGLGSGISCCSVPGYIFMISNDSNRGFYMSFNSIGIITGLIVGKCLSVFVKEDYFEAALMAIMGYLVLHSMALTLIKDVKPKQDKDDSGQRSILELFSNSKALKSVLLAVSFHVAQHACGVDYFSCFIDEIFEKNDYAGVKGIGCLTFSAIVSISSANYIDKLGRKPMIIISSSIILLSTGIMGTGIVNVPVALLYMLGFNVGLSSIPWFITNEMFPYEYFNAAQRLSVGINWMSAFIFALSLKPTHEYYGHPTYFFYSFSMTVFIIIVLVLFKETKGKSVGFQ
ncbi:Solute carrier family 2, facilitated glucose transporter member 3 [Nosema granulosis]|uniref:Solute carrier family 2, facilitated glucose transporter member 3 n=1 Tax=Nosema granulosis TaxID=83296 RepID=A0A9P6GYF3_9MICR|nr:Solute carrier family 2, facilitated glucose transporter member 3 [Nosema granulosis]